MKDPVRLLEDTVSVEARLLSALDEPAPDELLERALASVGTVSTAPSAAAPAASAKVAASSGILGSVGVGALAGLVAVGALSVFPTRNRPHEAAPRAVVAVVASPSGGTAAPPIPPPATDERASSTDARVNAESARTSAFVPSPPARPAHTTLADEIALLDEARGALHAGDPARAKALMDRYARDVPRGQLAIDAARIREQATEALAEQNP